MMRYVKSLFVLVLAMMLFACNDQTIASPKNLRAICDIFEAHPAWYRATHRVQKKYGVPVSLQMAVIAQESGFRAEAEPKREKLFGWLPWLRPSSAQGYAQVLDGTWRYYLHKTGKLSGNREYFLDSVEFVGWYFQRIHRRLDIPMSDTYHLYLAYHEGIHGYQTHVYWRHPQVMSIARHVQNMAQHYHARLTQCGTHLDRLL